MEEIDELIASTQMISAQIISEQLKHYHIDQKWLVQANWIEQLLKVL